MYLKGMQGVRGRKVIPTQTESRLGQDSRLLAPKRGRLQRGGAHSNICPHINSAILWFETQEPEVRYGVFVLCSLQSPMPQHYPIASNTWEQSGPKEIIWGHPTGMYTCRCWLLFVSFRDAQTVGTEEGLGFQQRLLMEMH